MKPTSSQRSYTIATLLIAAFLAAQPARADEIKIRLPAPPGLPAPRIVLPAPPPMIWLPGLQVYVAHDSPHHIFYHDGHYYLFRDNVWYMGPGFAGPWLIVKVRQVPPGLHGFRGERWEEYEHEADRRYRDWHDDDEHHPFYAGRERGRGERAYWKGEEHDRGWHGRGQDMREQHGRGRGRDKDDD